MKFILGFAAAAVIALSGAPALSTLGDGVGTHGDGVTTGIPMCGERIPCPKPDSIGDGVATRIGDGVSAGIPMCGERIPCPKQD